MIRRPEELPGAAARLRGHHATPGDIVLIGYRNNVVAMVQAFNIGDLPAGPDALIEACLHLAGHFRRERVNVALLAFGDDATIGPAFAATAIALEAGQQAQLTMAYRVTGDRMFCLICDDCAPEGLTIPDGGSGDHDVAADRATPGTPQLSPTQCSRPPKKRSPDTPSPLPTRPPPASWPTRSRQPESPPSTAP